MEKKLFLGYYLIRMILLLGLLHGCKSCIEKERTALLELKKYMISSSVEWDSVLPTWTNDIKSNCCRWTGIKCNRTSGRVIELSIRPTYFKDSSILNLSLLYPFEDLRSLNLSGFGYGYNRLSAFFDDVEGYKSFKRLRNLEIIDLSRNIFNHSILPFLNAATSITFLSLQGNYMVGPNPFKELKDLTNLELLDLSGNSFNGSTPELAHLKNLKSLDLTAYHISLMEIKNNYYSTQKREGMDLQALKDLTNLEKLGLSGNELKGSMLVLTHLKKLKSLDLSSNLFSSLMELQALKDLTNLEMLDLSENRLHGSMSELTHLKKLKTLDLSSNEISSSIDLQELKNLINLEVLDLAENHLDGPIPIEVFCKMKNLRKLDLRGNHFVGQLPLSFGSLNKLRVLDLSSNQLNGNLPSSFGSLESLEYLSLLDNNFRGLFSLNPLTNLTKIKVFKLSSRSRTVQIKTESTWQPKFQLSVLVLRLCNLEKIPSFLLHQKKLRLFDLSSNRLSGSIPTWLLENNLELEVLQLQNNSFTIFHMPPMMHNLQVLDFSVNGIRLFPDNISLALPNLVHMNGSKNWFQGNFPLSTGEMKNLLFLDLSYNNFSGELPRSYFTSCFLLQFLILSHNKFSGPFLPRRTSFSSMKVLRMDNNLFTGKIGVGLLSANNTLRVLDMSYNSLTGAIPSWISKLSSVKYLLISNNFLEGTLPPSLLVMPYLSTLDLSGNLFYGVLPSHVNSALWSKSLFLHDNKFTGKIPDTFFETVEILDLRNNKLFGSIPQIVHTKNINILLLRGNNLTGSIPKHLCNLSNVRLLDLSDNQLDGFIPSCLNNLSFGLGEEKKMVRKFVDRGSFSISFQSEFYKSTFVVEELEVKYYIYQEIEIKFASKQRYDSYSGRSEFSEGILGYMNGMDLSNNKLSGVIPAELGDLSKLRALNLSHNFLSSSIPSSFSKFQDIESLDLSHNMLDGRIPQQLTSLTSLAVLDVSYNNLSGIIPQGKQFNTFNEISYIGNPLLCGPPTDRRCETKKTSEEAYNRGEEEDDEAAIDMLVFYYSAASTYVAALVGILVLMCLNCPWRRAWLLLVDTSIASAKRMLP